MNLTKEIIKYSAIAILVLWYIGSSCEDKFNSIGDEGYVTVIIDCDSPKHCLQKMTYKSLIKEIKKGIGNKSDIWYSEFDKGSK